MFFSFSASLTQAVRNFAKGLEGWLINSLEQIPKKMADVKVSVSMDIVSLSTSSQFFMEECVSKINVMLC